MALTEDNFEFIIKNCVLEILIRQEVMLMFSWISKFVSSMKGGVTMVTALSVANSILHRAFDEDIDVTPMKLQKLIYFVYRKYLKLTNESLFSEKFEVWRYGPVIESIYYKFKKYGSNAIRDYGREENKKIRVVNEESSDEIAKALSSVWNKYKEYDGSYLSMLTHEDGTAWRIAYNKDEIYLDDNDIKNEVEI